MKLSSGQAVEIRELADRALLKLEASENDQVFIAIAGGPGSGKSTVAAKVCDELNRIGQQWQGGGDGDDDDDDENDGQEIAVVLPMDGYHMTKSDLKDKAFFCTESYQAILRRKGDPDTFRPEKFATDLMLAKEVGRGSFPIYDRSISDPIPDGVAFEKHHKIILCEGLYLLSLQDADWSVFADLWDDRWLLDLPIETVRPRLVQRHLENWTKEKIEIWGEGNRGAEKKVDTVDLKRTTFISKKSEKHCNLRITSVLE